MSLHQPVPFSVRKGKLVDYFGNPVKMRNIHNLKVIAEYMNKDTNPDINEMWVVIESIEDNTISDLIVEGLIS